ncbi:MAG: hypothetical protein RLN94_14015 [Roseovarius sp.]
MSARKANVPVGHDVPGIVPIAAAPARQISGKTQRGPELPRGGLVGNT